VSGVVLVQACFAADYDAATQTCASPTWVAYQPSPFPSLTAAEGAQIGAAIVGAWAVGAGLRAIFRAIK
jgi:hypothetical protein